jgi:hypothetical protein
MTALAALMRSLDPPFVEKQEPDQYRLSAATDTTELCQNIYQPPGHTFRDIGRTQPIAPGCRRRDTGSHHDQAAPEKRR